MNRPQLLQAADCVKTTNLILTGSVTQCAIFAYASGSFTTIKLSFALAMLAARLASGNIAAPSEVSFVTAAPAATAEPTIELAGFACLLYGSAGILAAMRTNRAIAPRCRQATIAYLTVSRV